MSLGTKPLQAFEGAVEDFDLRAVVVAADDSDGRVVVDLLGGESVADAADHAADDAALFFQIAQLGESVLVGIDGDGAVAIVGDEFVTASEERNDAPITMRR